MTQIKVTDWAVRTLVAATFLAYFFAPSSMLFPLTTFNFAAIGLWAVVYPEGALGWAKTAHPAIDVNDSKLWRIPRLIGAFFVVFAVMLLLVSRR